MKKWLPLVIVLCTISTYGQELFLPLNNFKCQKIKPSLFEKDERIFDYFSFEKELQQSILLVNNNSFRHLKTNIEFNKPSDLKKINKIDYDQMFFGCGPVNSKDQMFSAIKNYVLNKYVFSLFMNNTYE